MITRIAGISAPGYSGDGGPALDAQLSRPGGLALDGAGNLYIADVDNHRIRKVSADRISLRWRAPAWPGSQAMADPQSKRKCILPLALP